MHYVAVCQEQAAALERLIADLFAYTKVEYLEQEPLEMGALLHSHHAPRGATADERAVHGYFQSRAVESPEPRAATNGVTLVVSGPPVPCPLSGDVQLLTLAVENLLDNALPYTPEGGCIRTSG